MKKELTYKDQLTASINVLKDVTEVMEDVLQICDKIEKRNYKGSEKRDFLSLEDQADEIERIHERVDVLRHTIIHHSMIMVKNYKANEYSEFILKNAVWLQDLWMYLQEVTYDLMNEYDPP